MARIDKQITNVIPAESEPYTDDNRTARSIILTGSMKTPIRMVIIFISVYYSALFTTIPDWSTNR